MDQPPIKLIHNDMDNLKKAITNRRSYYSINDKSPISDQQIKDLVDLAVRNVPSAFNSQSARLVLLLNEHHRKFWNIVKEVLRAKARSEEAFAQTKAKIEGSFEAGHGTILFYEDQGAVRKLQEQFPTYSDNFTVWSQHTSAMHQFAMWILLEDAGFGASLQHYNPLIDTEVAAQWKIDPDWKLIAQMPFGMPTAEPGVKEFEPLDGRSIVFE